MALARALSSLRASVLSRVSIPIPVHGSSWQTAGTRPSLGFLRGFAEGTYLDKAEVEERVVKAIKNFDKVDPSKVTPTAHFQKDLGLDSLDTVEVVMAFEEEFAIEIPDSEADKIMSTADAVSYIAAHPHAK